MLYEVRKEELKEKLEKVVRYHKKYLKAMDGLEEGFEGCCFCRAVEGIQVYQGIQEMAMAVNENIYKKERSDNLYPFEYYFYYKDIRFFSLSKN